MVACDAGGVNVNVEGVALEGVALPKPVKPLNREADSED